MSVELETSLDWVTFSEEDHGDVCEAAHNTCSNEAVYDAWIQGDTCYTVLKICDPCASYYRRAAGYVRCMKCRYVGMLVVRPLKA